ncbi:PREDICTED: TBC1 domain family member 5 homolog A-like [Camelina sativa]|uniref:TBC1 domain family member 5 homolog A-like n=1 Tax=Camelina sativa TaxID=90675 RepID=A0ABM0TXY0_CAMSA|nr:PREDICTED: TBC1 domain family member 5 homolog A-like [Camelina sativa]
MVPSEIETLGDESDHRFANLRGVRWRLNLGVLPFHSSSSIDDLRKATAESRRRYAALRRRLLIDPHLSKHVRNSPDLSIDNPLSQNPDSTWSRFFRNAELEKTLDQDLSRLYPEHWTYFQAPGCQGMLRRILLLWCLKHPEYGYRQGMHELLAPLLYVLHVDVDRLSEVRKSYEDHFTDRFDGLSFEERDVTYNFDFKKFLEDFTDDEIGGIQGSSKKIKSLDELDPEIQSIVRLSDAYGAEGELGIVLSEKFMEHDAYCMFDALMNGAHGCVAMAGFFAYSPATGSHTGLPPVLEACTAFYHLLSFVDSSLHSHLVELGVEPQYFGLRWLRVLFGREFLLQDLLIVWDEIFSADNTTRTDEDNNTNQSYKIFDSPRGALISGMAVSMILCLRSSLLATENAASCLQRLLNFPEKIDVRKIIEKAKSLQTLALDDDVRSSALSINDGFDQSISPAVPARTNSFPSGSTSPKSPLIIAPQSYWEEKWRVLHQAAEEEKQSPSVQKKKPWFRVKRLFRTESEPTHNAKSSNGKGEVKVSSVARNLLEDFNRQLVSEPEEANPIDVVNNEDSSIRETDEINTDFETAGEESIAVEENSSDVSSDPNSPLRDSNYIENDSYSSNESDLFPNETVKDQEIRVVDSPLSISSQPSMEFPVTQSKDQETDVVDSPLPVSSEPSIEFPVTQSHEEEDSADKSVAIMKERSKVLPGKFQWFWKFGRNLTAEETRSNSGESSKSNLVGSSESHSLPQASSSSSKGDTDQKVMNTLKNLGNSMLEHIQVIESVFQQERGQVQAGLIENLSKTNLVEKGQITAMTALKELRKISNLLLEM